MWTTGLCAGYQDFALTVKEVVVRDGISADYLFDTDKECTLLVRKVAH